VPQQSRSRDALSRPNANGPTESCSSRTAGDVLPIFFDGKWKENEEKVRKSEDLYRIESDKTRIPLDPCFMILLLDTSGYIIWRLLVSMLSVDWSVDWVISYVIPIYVEYPSIQ
jgi:hypothetical protein